MTRLTNAIRDQIVINASNKAGFIKRRNEVMREIQIIRFKLVIQYWGGEEKYAALERKLKEIRTKSDNLSELGVSISLNLDNTSWRNDSMNIAGMTMNYPYLENLEGYEHRILIKTKEKMIITHSDLVDELMEKEKQANELSESDNSVRTNVRALVNSVGSVKKLIEVWPESAELIPSELEVIKKQLPAINMSSLNASIGIPSTP